jgi:predicted hotdog family 3-hydroxylacyl-ACP dehydratase
MDRIGRVRAEDDIARRSDRLRHIGKAFLGAEGRDDLRLRVQLHAETAGVVGGLGAAQARNTLRGGITVRARVLNHFAKLVYDCLWGRQIGVAHAKVDDIGTTRSRACFQTVDLFENIRRQTPDLVKLFHL